MTYWYTGYTIMTKGEFSCISIIFLYHNGLLSIFYLLVKASISWYIVISQLLCPIKTCSFRKDWFVSTLHDYHVYFLLFTTCTCLINQSHMIRPYVVLYSGPSLFLHVLWLLAFTWHLNITFLWDCTYDVVPYISHKRTHVLNQRIVCLICVVFIIDCISMYNRSHTSSFSILLYPISSQKSVWYLCFSIS